MDKIYKCIKSFAFPNAENHLIAIIKGSKWKRTNGNVTENAVHLTEVGRAWNWIDITEEKLSEYFEKR